MELFGIASVRNVSLQRVYKDKDGSLKNINSFGMNNIPKAVLILEKAYGYLALDSTHCD